MSKIAFSTVIVLLKVVFLWYTIGETNGCSDHRSMKLSKGYAQSLMFDTFRSRPLWMWPSGTLIVPAKWEHSTEKHSGTFHLLTPVKPIFKEINRVWSVCWRLFLLKFRYIHWCDSCQRRETNHYLTPCCWTFNVYYAYEFHRHFIYSASDYVTDAMRISSNQYESPSKSTKDFSWCFRFIVLKTIFQNWTIVRCYCSSKGKYSWFILRQWWKGCWHKIKIWYWKHLQNYESVTAKHYDQGSDVDLLAMKSTTIFPFMKFRKMGYKSSPLGIVGHLYLSTGYLNHSSSMTLLTMKWLSGVYGTWGRVFGETIVIKNVDFRSILGRSKFKLNLTQTWN